TGPAAPGTPAASPATAVAPVAATPSPNALPGPDGAGRIVYFDYDSAVIKPEFRSLLDAHARYLATHASTRLTVGGHTDERGGREYNLALGQQRAEAVRRALQLLGVPPVQVEAISFGEEKPAKEGHEEAAWSGNRRAELAYR
ncbi:MAG TPA: peptidoglycan-associated lipoprotein Pal, partial [Ramlibacter sp.]|uniref:peptidoglycan-associated lipoprotein Pal n=1 Tax=Ramlibacter sp. TaxID=1917967 RepID=UPI002D7F6514